MIPGLFFANPWGLVAMAAVPALVAVHFLQERSKRVRSSTLFLLERAAPLPAGGMRFEKFRNSLPFWMQLLALLAITWLLADPRWVRNDSRQTVVVVLDSSASMAAFRESTHHLLANRLAAWNTVASRTDWHLLETGPGRPPLYAGRKLEELEKSMEGWQPTLATHDPGASLALADSLVPGDAGIVVLVTDRPAIVPGTVAVLSAGEPFANVGFSGGDVVHDGKRLMWRAIVMNHGDRPQTRMLSTRALDNAGKPQAIGEPQSIQLEGGQSRAVEGTWPQNAESLVLALTDDRFRADDNLPLVRSAPRIVKVAINVSGPAGDLFSRMVKALSRVALCADEDKPDVVIRRFDPVATTDGIQLTVEAAPTSGASEPTSPTGKLQPVAYDPAWVAAEDHPLTRDLGWAGLLSGPAGDRALSPSDEPLLWKGGKPLAFVHSTVQPGGRKVQNLVLNFDVAGSTAAHSPAAVVLVQRFIDRIRTRIDRPWADNFETGQTLDIPSSILESSTERAVMNVVSLDETSTSVRVPFRGRAPWLPGFFTVLRATHPAGPTPFLRGAAHFADAREGDFRKAAPLDTLESVRLAQAIKQSVADPWAPLWAGLAIGALLVAWGWKGFSARGSVDHVQVRIGS